MKRNLMLVGAFVASALYFTTCQNCDEVVAAEKKSCEDQMTAKAAEMDAMNAEWTAKYDAAVMTSDSLMMVIEEMNAPKTATTTTKKATTPKATAPATNGKVDLGTQSTGKKIDVGTQSTGKKIDVGGK